MEDEAEEPRHVAGRRCPWAVRVGWQAVSSRQPTQPVTRVTTRAISKSPVWISWLCSKVVLVSSTNWNIFCSFVFCYVVLDTMTRNPRLPKHVSRLWHRPQNLRVPPPLNIVWPAPQVTFDYYYFYLVQVSKQCTQRIQKRTWAAVGLPLWYCWSEAHDLLQDIVTDFCVSLIARHTCDSHNLTLGAVAALIVAKLLSPPRLFISLAQDSMAAFLITYCLSVSIVSKQHCP